MKSRFLYLAIVLFLGSSCTTSQVEILTPGKTIERSISHSESHTFQIGLRAGEFLRLHVEQIGFDVVISLFHPDGKKIDEVDITGSNEIETVIIKPSKSGAYQIKVNPFDYEISEGGKFRISIDELLSADEYADQREPERVQRQATIEWLREKAIPLRGVEPEQGFEDMQPLKEIIGEARLVALGEATHGTREFFQLKHRMLEFLVNEMGFTVFAIEATMPETFDVNEYVLTGKGDPEKALTALYFWTWNTEEVLEMIRWMRRYNADPNHTKKVKFYGIDMQFSTKAFKVLENYLEEVDSTSASSIHESASLSLIKNPYLEQDFYDLRPEQQHEAMNLISEKLAELEKNKEKYIQRTGRNAWELAYLHARILAQFVGVRIRSSLGAMFANRDSAMALNVQWILQHEGPDAKMVLWAHNYHVSSEKTPANHTMGYHLRQMYGDEMAVFGFAFHQGSFQAIELPLGGGGGLRPFHVTPLEEGSLDATLGATGLAYAAVDLHAIPDTGLVAGWFSQPHKTRSFGAVFDPHSPSNFAEPRQVPLLYDVLLYVDETTAARPNPGGTRLRQVIQSSPENMDFEAGDVGAIPDGWRANKYRLANFDFVVETASDKPYSGEKCVRIRRAPGKHYGEMYGSLSQRLNATSFRGKVVKLKGAVRTHLENPESHAYMWLNVTRGGFGPRARLFRDSMGDRPIATKEWRIYEITGRVPDEAQWIDFGLAMTGEGSAWFDSISLETVESQQASKPQ